MLGYGSTETHLDTFEWQKSSDSGLVKIQDFFHLSINKTVGLSQKIQTHPCTSKSAGQCIISPLDGETCRNFFIISLFFCRADSRPTAPAAVAPPKVVKRNISAIIIFEGCFIEPQRETRSMAKANRLFYRPISGRAANRIKPLFVTS